MLVMAIEAARQMAEARRGIKGYLIQDTMFHNAVNVPKNDHGLEMQFHMRPIQDASEKSASRSEFRVYTYKQDHWVENCRGAVKLEYEENKAEVNQGTEAAHKRRHYQNLATKKTKACDETTHPERMYKHFRDIGMGYGPAFRGLQNITFNEEGDASAEVRLFGRSSYGVANDVESHVIHPVTPNLAAQLIFLALTKGAKRLIPTTIPTRVRSLWVSSYGLSHLGATSIKSYATSAFKGYRETESSLFALDMTTRNLLLSISSLEMTTVASCDALSPSESKPKRLCYSMDWKPDVDLLSSKQLHNLVLDTEDSDEAHSAKHFQEVGLLLFTYISRTEDQISLQDAEN